MRHHQKYLLLVGIMALAYGCSGSNFAGDSGSHGGGGGSNGSGKKPGGPGSNGPADGGTFNNGPNNNNTPGGNPDLSALSGLSTICGTVPKYDPKSVQCNIGVGDPNNGWTANHGASWNQYVNQFKDRTASWISPLAAFDDGGGKMLCPHVPSSEKLIYVSYFDAPAAGSYRVEALDDDSGTLQLWKDTDSTKVVGSTNVPAFSGSNLSLEQARYAVIIDGTDSGTASAAAFSVQDSTGKVIKNSKSDGSWCIFRVAASENTANFVRDNAGCLPCLGRVTK